MVCHSCYRVIRVAALLAGLACVCPFGCSEDPASPEPTNGEPEDQEQILPGEVDEHLALAHTQFGVRLLQELWCPEQNSSVFISPPSVALALSMTLNGARGETERAMMEVLEFEGLSRNEVNEASAALIKRLTRSDPKVELAIGNSLWARESVTFYPEFLRTNESYYEAEVATLDFADPMALTVINGWVDDATHGKITTIINQIPDDAILYLINAIYFRGTWQTAFDSAETDSRPFTLVDGTEKQHPMMHRYDIYRYLRGGDFQAVDLPYGDDGRMSMCVFLPHRGSSLSSFVAGLSADAWNEWTSRFYEKEGDLWLPRFRLEYEVSLIDALESLGMGVAFDEWRADFSGMLPVFGGRNVFIGEVKHKTFVEVNEEGTEAAAVTEVGAHATCNTCGPFVMVVDRPFFFAIRDNVTGVVLFMGAIVEPM